MSNIAIILLRRNTLSHSELEMFMIAQKHYEYNCDNCKQNNCMEHIEYTNPAGKILAGESNKDAAKREFLEETGQSLPELDINNIKVYEECDTVIIIALTNDMTLKSQKINNDEVESVNWIRLSDIPKLKQRNIFKKLYNNYISIWKSMTKN